MAQNLPDLVHRSAGTAEEGWPIPPDLVVEEGRPIPPGLEVEGGRPLACLAAAGGT